VVAPLNLQDRTLSLAEARVLALLRQSGPQSRAELAEHLRYSRANITAVIKNLLARGIIEKLGLGESQGGRRPRLYGINGRLGYVAGVDIGATSLDLALAGFDGVILERLAEPADVHEQPQILLGRAAGAIERMIEQHGGSAEQVLAIGIGVPGPVQFDEGVLVAPPLMPAWESFSIREFMSQRFSAANITVDNDNFLFLKIGTGIGCGIICQDQIYRGCDGAAGDVGHICIDYNGPVCHCGNAGCLEIMAAGPAIAARGLGAAVSGESEQLAAALAANNGVMTAQMVGDAAKAGDRAANEIVKSSGRMIGGMLAGLVNFFNPQLILIGGGVSNIGIRLLSAIRQAVLRRSTALSTRHLRIEFSPLGKDAGVIGAIWLALEHVFTIEA
jgi:predicted NBD/HSP70 family sugar kinase